MLPCATTLAREHELQLRGRWMDMLVSQKLKGCPVDPQVKRLPYNRFPAHRSMGLTLPREAGIRKAHRGTSTRRNFTAFSAREKKPEQDPSFLLYSDGVEVWAAYPKGRWMAGFA